jgi:hypothetical protein
MWRCENNQEVGLEAATLERVRNSSLVACRRADNLTGQSRVPKLRMCEVLSRMVGERRRGREAAAEASRGATTSANAGTSNREVGCEPPPPKA